ncbi:MAG: protease 2 [Phycisphaerae bacterium SM23_30]|nr:MAG: protease 2 [Phycisphaerae bacterium SM23_30]
MGLEAEVASAEAPAAKIEAQETTIHGEKRIDDYYWLRERDKAEAFAEIKEYLQAENRYTRIKMEHTLGLQRRLEEEMVGRIKEDDETAPVRIDDYYYYRRTEKGKQYVIHCRKKGDLEAKEEIVLDENELAAGRDYFRLGAFKVSGDHNLLAYAVDTDGSEVFTIYVKDLTRGELLPDELKGAATGLEWANDNETLFYNTRDEARRPYMLYRHKLGGDPKEDAPVYHEEDQAFNLRLSKSKSRQYLFITLASNTTTEVRYLRADEPTGQFKMIHPRQHQVEYYVVHSGDKFYIRTNEEAPNFMLAEAPAADPSKENWVDFLDHQDDVMIEGMEAFARHLVLYERSRGIKQIRIMNLPLSHHHYVEFDEAVYTVSPGENPNYEGVLLRFHYTSLVTPRSVYDYHMDDMSRELKKQDEIPSGYEMENYTSERITAPAADGTAIPISLVYKSGMMRNGNNPLLLYGYGSYGASREPSFSANRLSLLDRGFIYAIAHIRGGGEMGRTWYDQGKLLQKRNTFTDFIACAEHLIEQRYTSREKLAIMGGSAGGLLIGAALNMRGELFQAAVAKVPFVDVVNTMLDASIPLTVIEYEEWGNPRQKKYYDYMMTYSPYDNVEAKDYPNLLITAGLNDPRVPYWEPAKWTARLRALKTDDNLLLLKTNMGAGHGGASGRYDYLKDIAFEYAFILDRLGIRQ